MPDMTFEESLSQWWDEDADRINSMSEMAREFAVATPKEKKESRAFCPTGEGKGVDNSCGVGKGSPEDQEDIEPSAKAPDEPTDTVDSSADSKFGTSTDEAATKTSVQSAVGEIEVIDRTNIHTRDYLDEIESDAEDKGMVVDFKQAPALQSSTDLDDDDVAYRAFLGSAYPAFTGQDSSADLSELDEYGPEYGLMTEYEAEQRVVELIGEKWDELDKDEWFGSDKPWSSMSPDEQADQETEWKDSQYTEVYQEVEGDREEARSMAINDMRRNLESSLASATLDCCLQLYRGLQLTPDAVDQIIKDGSITHSGPNSWTTSRNTSKGFGALGTLLVLRKPRVGHVHVANTGDEAEVTRPPSKLKLIGVVKTSSGNVLYLDEDDDYKDL